MTAVARISQADMDRAAKAIAHSGIERARIIMRLATGEIEIIIGESGPSPKADEWDRE